MAARHSGHARWWRRAVASLVLFFGGAGFAVAQGTTASCVSGYELSPGIDSGDGVNRNVIFIGSDNRPDVDGGANVAACDAWTSNGSGGSWVVRVDRTGNAGIGSGAGVAVHGGRWFWLGPDDQLRVGRVEQGYVLWPDTLEQDKFGCGPGVGQFHLTLSEPLTFRTGTLTGCLDDTHLDPTRQPFVLPPRVWGTLTLN
jgi:hypothetical protein